MLGGKGGGGHIHVGTPASVPTLSGIVCYAPTLITSNGIWQGDNPLDFSLPLFVLQVTLIVTVSRLLFLLLKRFRLPRVVADIIGGVLLGPSVMGQLPILPDVLFPSRSLTVLETVAHLGLLYFLFLVGVEMDVTMVGRTGRKALLVAAAGMLLPLVIGTSTTYLLMDEISPDGHCMPFLLFLGVALSMTAFPVLARILAELKLLNTEVGRVATSSALLNDVCGWVLLELALALSEREEKDTVKSLSCVVVSAVIFALFCFLVFRPGVQWIVRRTPEGEPVDDAYVCAILTGVMACGLVADALGVHSIFGAFVFGLVIPNGGALGIALVERLEDFVSGLLLPLFFAVSGLRTNVFAITWGLTTTGYLSIVIMVVTLAKIAFTVAVALFYNMALRDGVSLGALMNTKGLIHIIILNVGRDKEVISTTY